MDLGGREPLIKVARIILGWHVSHNPGCDYLLGEVAKVQGHHVLWTSVGCTPTFEGVVLLKGTIVTV